MAMKHIQARPQPHSSLSVGLPPHPHVLLLHPRCALGYTGTQFHTRLTAASTLFSLNSPKTRFLTLNSLHSTGCWLCSVIVVFILRFPFVFQKAFQVIFKQCPCKEATALRCLSYVEWELRRNKSNHDSKVKWSNTIASKTNESFFKNTQ